MEIPCILFEMVMSFPHDSLIVLLLILFYLFHSLIYTKVGFIYKSISFDFDSFFFSLRA